MGTLDSSLSSLIWCISSLYNNILFESSIVIRRHQEVQFAADYPGKPNGYQMLDWEGEEW